jgi:hypothetical protein
MPTRRAARTLVAAKVAPAAQMSSLRVGVVIFGGHDPVVQHFLIKTQAESMRRSRMLHQNGALQAQSSCERPLIAASLVR